MFYCKFSTCGSVFDTVLKFIQHIKLHNSSANHVYQCGVPEYQRTYFKITALKAHMYRDHKADWPLWNSQLPFCDSPIQCDFCAVRCESSSLACHLRSHLQEGLQVRCSFRGCDSKFTVGSSFVSHISRKHKNESVVHVDPSNVERCVAT